MRRGPPSPTANNALSGAPDSCHKIVLVLNAVVSERKAGSERQQTATNERVGDRSSVLRRHAEVIQKRDQVD